MPKQKYPVLAFSSSETRNLFDILHSLRIERQKRIVRQLAKRRETKIPKDMMLG